MDRGLMAKEDWSKLGFRETKAEAKSVNRGCSGSKTIFNWLMIFKFIYNTVYPGFTNSAEAAERQG